MRFLAALVVNGLLLLRQLLALPLHLLRSRSRPQFIRYELQGDPPYLLQRSRRWLFGRRGSPFQVRSIDELRRQVKSLIADSQVKGVVVVVEGLQISAAKREALAELFRQLRGAGKLVVGYATQARNTEFELLCSADRIVLFQAGRLELTGFMAEATALRDGLRRVGITAHFVRRGQYKTAPELFTLPAVSEAQRQTIEKLLDDRFAVLIAVISQGRRIDEAQARAKVDRGPYTAKRALAEGLCDALRSEEELPQYLRELDANPPSSTDALPSIGSFTAYARSKPFRAVRWRRFKQLPRVACVPISGLIVPGEVSGALSGMRLAGSKTVGKALKAAAADHRVRAILLDVASPGGSALASELILEEVRRVSKKKPVLAYTDQVAASGGYLAALGAREIWAAPHAVVGSIGVFAGKFEVSELLERLGIHRTTLTRGENAGIFSSSRPFTEQELQVLEAEVEETYQDFLEHVAQARGKTREEAHQRGEGRVYSGAEAMQVGLLDRTGGFDGACKRALELAGASSHSYQIASYAPAARRFSLLNALREISSVHLYALCDPWLDFGGERWIDSEGANDPLPRESSSLLGALVKSLLSALVLGLALLACATSGTLGNQPSALAGTASPHDEVTPDQVLRQFLSAADAKDFESAYRLLAGIWRAQYTPQRLQQDFELEPRAKELIDRARHALTQGAKVTGEVAEFPIGDGRAVRLVKENGAFKIAALE